jgi:hypothetical protein
MRTSSVPAVVNGGGGWYVIAMIPVIDLGPYLAGRPRRRDAA